MPGPRPTKFFSWSRQKDRGTVHLTDIFADLSSVVTPSASLSCNKNRRNTCKKPNSRNTLLESARSGELRKVKRFCRCVQKIFFGPICTEKSRYLDGELFKGSYEEKILHAGLPTYKFEAADGPVFVWQFAFDLRGFGEKGRENCSSRS